MTVLAALENQLIVSVQADEGEPLAPPECLLALAESALNGGAAGLRMANPENIRYVKARHPDVPMIGITKPHKIPSNAHELVYITPTLEDALSIAEAGAEIVALDATLRPRPNGETLEQIVSAMKQAYPEVLLMADIATFEDGEAAARTGFDLISTTLAGYTSDTRDLYDDEPAYALLSTLVHTVDIPVILEGHVWVPDQCRIALDLGAHAVVVGSAITRPQLITRRFRQAMQLSPTP